MNGQYIYLLVLLSFLVLIFFLQKKYQLLADSGTNSIKKAYSLSRTQLVWWLFIVLSTIVAIVIGSGKLPKLTESTLVLLGIGALTTISSRLTDISDDKKAAGNGTTAQISRNDSTGNFLLDILSDNEGVSIHRLQSVVFNLIFGVWFMYKVMIEIKGISPCITGVNNMIPNFDKSNLIMMGISSGTYIALKTTENAHLSLPITKPDTQTTNTVADTNC